MYCYICLGYAFAKRVSMLLFITFGRLKLAVDAAAAAAAAAVICLSALERYCLSVALFWLKLQLSSPSPSPSKSCNRKQKLNENSTEARKLTVVTLFVLFFCCFFVIPHFVDFPKSLISCIHYNCSAC